MLKGFGQVQLDFSSACLPANSEGSGVFFKSFPEGVQLHFRGNGFCAGILNDIFDAPQAAKVIYKAVKISVSFQIDIGTSDNFF